MNAVCRFLQFFGGACLIIVVLTHVAETLHIFSPGQVPAGPLTKAPVKFPVAGSTAKTFSSAPRWLCQTEGNKPCAEDAAADARRRNRAAMIRNILCSRLVVACGNTIGDAKVARPAATSFHAVTCV